ncbi:RNA polymerase sigma factor [Phytohalomonas tamaricis]|uniref:RNA polymerase sigma factor n=1 Tax=Phytohalomonas tamaricis TaxID=2081032 RepID=UPI000D0AD614|nr:RNA polymerase sigma factor [Phytohalomonas tamaricis]|tara:strand:+ start:1425 stop:1946 length:522 start_codon:yes stop_codon:yes gene_type:complete
MNPPDDDQLREVLPRLRRFALSLTQNPNDADDLVQSTMEKAIGHWQRRRPDGDLRAWLFSILYRQFIDGRRRAGRYARLMQLFTSDPQTSASTEDIVVANATWEAFDRLPPEHRALLMLVSVEGLSYREVSETLNIPIGTVMSRLSRARRSLRDLDEGTSHEKHSSPSLRRLK